MRRVFYFEEPVFDASEPQLDLSPRSENLWVAVPHLPAGVSDEAAARLQRMLLDDFLEARGIEEFACWYYTPMALAFSRHLSPTAIAYDGMDELSMIKGAHPRLLPFARNDSTRYISPTKTPEYLAAGRPVISTSIRDVVRPYSEEGLVHIADSADTFVAAAGTIFAEDEHRAEWRARVDAFLAENSWDRTSSEMSRLLGRVTEARAETEIGTAEAACGDVAA